MILATLAESASKLGQDALIWVGFGMVAGLLAKAVMPGRDPGGAVATVAMGIGGSIIGCGILAYFSGERVSPLSILGFLVAVGGSFALLVFYRLLGGYFFIEGDGGPRIARRHSAPRRRRSYSRYED